jgi:hypothetical protein
MTFYLQSHFYKWDVHTIDVTGFEQIITTIVLLERLIHEAILWESINGSPALKAIDMCQR